MKPEVYNKNPKTKKRHFKLAIFFAFIVISAFLLYSAYSGNSILTGGVISSGELQENGIKLNTELTIPEMDLDSKFDKIEISGSGGIFRAENQEFDLSTSENARIIITDYDGKLSFDSIGITQLKGKASSVSINGIPIKKSKGKMKISFKDEFSYKEIRIESLFINSRL